MLKKTNIWCFLSIILVLAGCVQKEIIDEIVLIEGIGFDYDEKNDQIVGTVQVPVFMKQGDVGNETHTASAKTKKKILQKIQRQVYGPVSIGSLEILLFGKKLAKEKGILELMDPFQRDPSVGSGFYVAIVDGDPKDVLEKSYGVRGTSYHLEELIENMVKSGNLPKTNFHRFLASFYQRGKTPFLPVIKLISKNEIKVSGIAFLKNGKIVDEISLEDAFYLKILMENIKNGFQEIKYKDEMVTIQGIYSRKKYVIEERDPYKISVYLNLNGIINEYTGNRVLDSEFKSIEKVIEDNIKDNCEKIIRRFQDKDIDPVGFGHFVKSKTRNFDFKKWYDIDYKQLTVEVHVNSKMDELGVVK